MNLQQYATGGNLSQQDSDAIQKQYGVNFGAQGYEGGALGDSGYEAYHTGTGWGVRQPGTQTGGVDSPHAPAAPQAPQNTQQVLNQTPQAGAPQTVTGAFQGALLNKLNAGPVTADSPQLKGAIDANKLAGQRSMERGQAQAAETAAAQGLDRNAMDSITRGMEQQRAQQEGAFQGGLVADAQQKQDQALMALLGLTGNMLGQQDALGMQKYSIDEGTALGNAQLSQSGQLGNKQLDNQFTLGQGNLNLGLLGLLANDAQFGQQLGANVGMFNAGLNQNALLSLLGGGL